MLAIRPAIPEDAPIIHGFVRDLAEYEKASEQVQLTEEDYARFMTEGGHFNAVIAESNDTPVGMAIWYKRFSTWVGDYMHLEDLYVDPISRGNGIGTELLRNLAQTAVDLGFRRMEWQVLDWNKPAIATYKSMGALILPEWQLCQMDEDSLAKFTGLDQKAG